MFASSPFLLCPFPLQISVSIECTPWSTRATLFSFQRCKATLFSSSTRSKGNIVTVREMERGDRGAMGHADAGRSGPVKLNQSVQTTGQSVQKRRKSMAPHEQQSYQLSIIVLCLLASSFCFLFTLTTPFYFYFLYYSLHSKKIRDHSSYI